MPRSARDGDAVGGDALLGRSPLSVQAVTKAMVNAQEAPRTQPGRERAFDLMVPIIGDAAR